jgi:hypothetical protein
VRQLHRQRIHVRLVARRDGNLRDHLLRVVLLAVEAPVDRPKTALRQRKR